MDTPDPNAWGEILRATLDDDRLSRGESKALRAVLGSLSGDAAAVARLRAVAYEIANERLAPGSAELLDWLHAVEGLILRAALPAPSGAARDQVAFSPGEDCLELILEHVRGARRTLDVCVFTITDDRISGALLAARARGVAVRIVTDDEKKWDPGSDVGRLRESGIPVREDRGESHMHHKFALFDRRRLLSGSYNWTRGAAWNHEDLHATSAPDVVAAFQARFDRLWDGLSAGDDA